MRFYIGLCGSIVIFYASLGDCVTTSECQQKTSMSEMFSCFAQLSLERERQNCRQPDNLGSMLCSHGSSLPSTIVFNENQTASNGGIPVHYRNVTRTLITASIRRCVPEPNVTSSDMLDRSACPWNYVINRDRYRYPSTIVEARCDCPRCSSPFSYMETGSCQPIKRYIRVIRVIGCVGNVYQYRAVFEPVVVGCHCVYAQVVRAS